MTSLITLTVIVVKASANGSAAKTNIIETPSVNLALATTTTKSLVVVANEATDTSEIATTDTVKTTLKKAKTKKATIVKATAAKKTTTKKTTTKKATTAKSTASSGGVRWASSGLVALGRLRGEPYAVRVAYKQKVESYARRNGITLITKAVVDGMHE